MNWPETQRAFAKALRDPGASVPIQVGPRTDGEPRERFNVYRNNSAVSLTEALADGFPVVRELVGDEFFTGMARAYVEHHVPHSPVLIHYGHAFAAFIDAFEPAQSLPFLADVARVEWAWTQAYHSADRDSINADALQTISPALLNDARVEIHPSLRMISSRWPAISIWSAHQLDNADEQKEAMQKIAQTGGFGFMVRPEFEVNVQLVEPAVWRLLSTFADGASFGQAADSLADGDAEQFGGMLGFIFSTGAIASVVVE